MITYRVLIGIDLLAAAVVLFFFLWGLSDGTVSSFNIPCRAAGAVLPDADHSSAEMELVAADSVIARSGATKQSRAKLLRPCGFAMTPCIR
jgi:nitrogen fixation-related uncharacterized protein